MNKKQNFQDASAEALFRQFIRGWAAIEYKYNPPSALRVEQTYAKYGIKLPFKIHYEYKVPAEFESQYGILFWISMEFYKQESFEEMWTQIQNVDVDKVPAGFDRDIVSYYRTFSKEQFAIFYSGLLKMLENWPVDKMIAEIKRLNPELANIKTDGKRSNIMGVVPDFINGVAYGFAPEDIDYCLNAPREEFSAYKEKTDRLNLAHGHIPAPSRLDALLVAEAEVKKVIAQRAQEKGLE
jgi:hypothetical protein